MPFPRDYDATRAAAVGGRLVRVRENSPKSEPAAPGGRAVLFIDGSNWYHSLKRIEVSSKLDYRAVASKLIRNRELVDSRYYVGRVTGDLRRMREQELYLGFLRDQGVSVHLGIVRRNPMNRQFVRERRRLAERISGYAAAIPVEVREAIEILCRSDYPQFVEKQVDTRMSVDLVRMAYRDEYDAAFLLSADSDFIPAVEAVRELGKRVIAASPAKMFELACAVDTFVPLRREWFEGLGADQAGPGGSSAVRRGG